MKGSVRHDFIYRYARLILSPILKAKFNMSIAKIKPRGAPYIVLCNHVTNYDPLLLGMSFSQSMYFVASDHIFRLGWLSSVLKFVVAPIARAKATTETHTVMQIFRTLKEGHNVCIFAEGNSTFTGETGEIPRSIAKLARRTGASLITCQLKGGYFSFPRWSTSVRRGHMSDRMVHEYSPEELRNMTDDELFHRINADLYVNAYEDQAKDKVAFKGKKLAENLETALYCCPNCLKFSTLKSCNDVLSCSCGLRLHYTEYGYLKPEVQDPPFKYFETILEWTTWQHTLLEDLATRAKEFTPDQVVFSDPSQTLLQTVRAKRNIPLAAGALTFYMDRFEIQKADQRVISFPYKEIADMSIITQMNIIFSTRDGISYEIHSSIPRSALKYLLLYRALS